MSEAEDQAKQWVRAWKIAAPVLETVRREEILRTDTPSALLALAQAFEFACLHTEPAPTSGLVEQQRYFKRLRR